MVNLREDGGGVAYLFPLPHLFKFQRQSGQWPGAKVAGNSLQAVRMAEELLDVSLFQGGFRYSTQSSQSVEF